MISVHFPQGNRRLSGRQKFVELNLRDPFRDNRLEETTSSSLTLLLTYFTTYFSQ